MSEQTNKLDQSTMSSVEHIADALDIVGLSFGVTDDSRIVFSDNYMGSFILTKEQVLQVGNAFLELARSLPDNEVAPLTEDEIWERYVLRYNIAKDIEDSERERLRALFGPANFYQMILSSLL